jgi:hypothetical protein
MTLEDVFVRKLKDDPLHILELSREFLAQDYGEGTYARAVIERHVISWMDLNEENEHLGRTVLGFDLVNALRPV